MRDQLLELATAPRLLRWRRAAVVAAWCYPLLLVAAFYVVWLTAWASLGHRPRPSLDDPGSISTLVDIVYFSSGMLLVGFPAAAFAGLLLTLWHAFAQRRSRPFTGGLVTAFTLLWVGAFSLLRWDPFDIINWYMD